MLLIIISKEANLLFVKKEDQLVFILVIHCTICLAHYVEVYQCHFYNNEINWLTLQNFGKNLSYCLQGLHITLVVFSEIEIFYVQNYLKKLHKMREI